VNINDFCVDERNKMLDLDKVVYNEQFWLKEYVRSPSWLLKLIPFELELFI
jgi:hypothetical protein